MRRLFQLVPLFLLVLAILCVTTQSALCELTCAIHAPGCTSAATQAAGAHQVTPSMHCAQTAPGFGTHLISLHPRSCPYQASLSLQPSPETTSHLHLHLDLHPLPSPAQKSLATPGMAPARAPRLPADTGRSATGLRV